MSKEQLKEEGNALFVKKQYGLAALKYTEAIELDEDNAILWANRAACRLNTRQYMDAASDAEKATEINPTYAKAWARLATAHDALHDYRYSTDAWQKALDSLPRENLNASEQKQKEQYAAGLEAAQAIINKPPQPAPVVYMRLTDEHPWVVAQRLIEQYQRTMFLNSSVPWMINEAYNTFKEGLDLMGEMKQQTDGKGMTWITARLGVVESLVNALILDKRVFHAQSNFFELIRKQVMSECMTVNAWTKTGPETIMREVPTRLEREGWDSVRPALSVTIRSWILRAFLGAGIQQSHDTALELMTCAVQLLKWGHETYKHVSKEDRGAIFSDTFIIGVRKLLLGTIMSAYSEKLDPQYLEDLYEEAMQLLKETSSLKPPEPSEGVGAGFYLSFYKYPRAEAQAALGFYHARLAMLPQMPESEAPDHWIKSILAYLSAADALPEDDEEHPWYLRVALGHMDKVPTPLSTKLDIHERIRASVLKAQAIWHMSSHSRSGVAQRYEQLAKIEEKLRDGLKAGKWSLQDIGVVVS